MAPWRLSASEWALGEVTTARAVERVAAAGLDGIELTARWPFDPAALRKLLDANGVVASGISPGYSLARDLSHVEDELRLRAITHLRQCLEMAQELDAPIVVVVASDRTAPLTTEQRRGAVARAAASIMTALDRAGTPGPRLALEPLNRYETSLVHTLAEADDLRILTGSARVGLMADTFHMNIEEDDPVAALRNVAGHIVHIDLADNQRHHPGTGNIDFPSIFTVLHQAGYEGWLNLECLPADEECLSAARRYISAVASSLAVGP
jgi:D-psicose/D-tagatose/L-ribulose 3-epimerase